MPDVAPSRQSETRRFGGNALVYLVSNVLMRGASFLLTPLYTRALAPGDFAVVSVANALVAVLSICLGMALYGCVPRLYFEHVGQERRAFFGTLLALSLTVPPALVVLLWGAGSLGYLDLFETVRFDPHVKLVLLTSLCNVYLPLPTAAYLSREEPKKVALLNTAAGLTQLTCPMVFVAVLHRGAVGVLQANLVSSAAMGAVSIVLMMRLSTLSLAMPGWARALRYSLPLVPHLVANWALAISDRLVLDRNVTSEALGRYALGYMFGLVVSVVAASFGNALSPMAIRQLKEDSAAPGVPPLGTYMIGATAAFALMVALSAREVIGIMAPPAYAGAAAVVPWVVLGAVFQGVYLVWSLGTWFSMKTALLPVVTATSAALNIGINVLFVPRYGVMTAAVSTAIAYGASAVLHGALAQRLHPIPWEYARWARLLGVGVLTYVVGAELAVGNLWLSLTAKVSFGVVAFPLGLALTGFFTRSEVGWARARLSRALARA